MKPATVTTTSEAIIDELMDLYLEWRDAAGEVDAAYARWHRTGGSDRVLAYGAYEAAVDREQSAARDYQWLVDRATAEWSEDT